MFCVKQKEFDCSTNVTAEHCLVIVVWLYDQCYLLGGLLFFNYLFAV